MYDLFKTYVHFVSYCVHLFLCVIDSQQVFWSGSFVLQECRCVCYMLYRGADKSLAQPTSQYILFDGENISFDASLVICINSTNIPPIMIRNRIYENQNLLSL